MRVARSVWPLAIALSAISVAQYPGAVPPPSAWKTGFDSITPSEGRKILSFLAGPETMGRGTGQPGYFKAADFVAAKFKSFGLKPVGENGSYFQYIPFWRSHFVDEGSDIKFIGSTVVLKAGEAFRLGSISAPIDSTSVVVELTPSGDDLGVDPADIAKRVVIVKGDKVSNFFRNRLISAKPAAVFFVKPTLPPTEFTVRRSAPSADAPARSPVGTLTTNAYTELMRNLNFVERTSGTGTMRVSSSFVRLTAKVEAGDLMVPNVVGLLEGSDPVLKNEIIGVGAHLDHLGVQNGEVYPGADDDGSGSTAMLEVARAFATNPVKPKRSILFMNFAGEEMGLVGSGWYASHPIFPNEKMISELQMDMVGRNSFGAQNGDQRRIDVESENIDTIRLVGSKRISTDLHNTILDVNKHVGFKFKYDAEDVYTRSDHYNFAKNGIPIAFLFSGFHPDYHRPTDTIDKINFDKIANAAKLFYLTAFTVSENPTAPRKDVGK